MPLGAGSALKLTTAHYLTPSGYTINERGIEPDAVVNFRSDLASQYGGANGTVGVDDDLQLSYALESLGFRAIALSQAQ